MNRVTKPDRRPSNSHRSYNLFFLLYVAVLISILPAQQTQGTLDSSATSSGTFSSFLASERLSWYSKMQKFELHEVELKYPSNSFQTFLDQTLLNYSFDPFKIDFRESSYYVPVLVRDELNLIMNRPRDSAFLPVLGIAWIAYQMASHYIELEQKRSIEYGEILTAYPALPILYTLWKVNPQTVKQLYQNENIQHTMTFQQVQEKLDLLQQNNLIKSRVISSDSLLYFPGLNREQLLSILDYADRNLMMTQMEKETIQFIRGSLWKDR